MGFLDKVKDATGIGLNSDEQYRRAYEKGVFLQPPNYEEAAKHFVTAAEKFRKDGNAAMAQRAEGNALLYRLVQHRALDTIPAVIAGLERVPEIERLASQTEMIATPTITAELRALQAELEAEGCASLIAKSDAYRRASQFAMQLGAAPLMLTERLKMTGPVEKAMLRGFYYSAMADYHFAFARLAESPEDTHDSLYKSAMSFRQAQVNDWAERADKDIEQVKARRHCWTCGREMQGRDHYFKYYPAATTQYHRRVVEALKQDGGMLDRDGTVTLCTVCGSTIEAQADHYASMRAEEIRKWVAPVLESQAQLIASLQSRIRTLEITR